MGNITGRGRNQLAPLEGQSFNYTVPQGVTNQGAMSAATAPTVVNVPVNAGTIVTNQELQGLITDTVRVALKSGNKLLPAGGIS
jgi:pectin methylesterase-like acyl-CoA thioesterase